MTQRFPSARAFANSTSKISIVYRAKSGPRLFEVSAGAAGAMVAGAALVATLALGASLYTFSKDALLRTVLNGQARMQYAYEDRIAQLRAHIDQIAGRQIVDQDTVETRLQSLLSRQVQLENRQAMVSRLADDAAKAGIRYNAAPKATLPDVFATGSLPGKAPVPAAAQGFINAPSKPLPDGIGAKADGFETIKTDRLTEMNLPITRQAIPMLLEQAERVAKATAAEQIATVQAIELKAQASASQFKVMLDQTGLERNRFARVLTKDTAKAPSKEASGIGGPLLPMPTSESALFEKSITASQRYLRESEGVSRIMRALPVRRPLPRQHDTSSTFGGRVDPFTRGYAMHSGLDFRASTGTPAKVTADGKVIAADWTGGYGKMVEVDHGFGLTTRYAHLSSIEVNVGDTLKKGEIVGLVGSTGRSTGPHLHYEVRIDEEAVDPITFLRAGEKSGVE